MAGVTAGMLTVGGIMGGLSMMSGILGGLGANQQAAAQQKLLQMQQENANFQRQGSVNANNRNITKSNLAKAIANRQIETLAISERAIAEVYGKMGYDNAKSQFSKQTNQINSALLSTVSGRNISSSSGTARALLRQNMDNAHTNLANLRITQANKTRDITTAYQNKLATRDFNYTELQSFIPGDTSTAYTGQSMGMIAGMSALQGLQTGIGAGLMYGAGSGSNSGGGGGGDGSDSSLSSSALSARQDARGF